MDHEIARIVQYVLIQFFYDMYTEKYLCYLNSSAQDSGLETFCFIYQGISPKKFNAKTFCSTRVFRSACF
jgi:hypothetical protein